MRESLGRALSIGKSLRTGPVLFRVLLIWFIGSFEPFSRMINAVRSLCIAGQRGERERQWLPFPSSRRHGITPQNIQLRHSADEYIDLSVIFLAKLL